MSVYIFFLVNLLFVYMVYFIGMVSFGLSNFVIMLVVVN